MTMTTYPTLIIRFVFILFIGLVMWMTFSYRNKEVIPPSSTPLLPDAFMEDVTATFIDKQGRISMKVVTPKLVHYANNDTTHFTAPTLTLYRQSPEPWVVTSLQAKAFQGMEKINFWDNVVIQHAADKKNIATTIKTATLTVYPELQTAETSDLITMIQPNIMVKATGMQADMTTGNIKLLSQAQGEYIPDV